MALQSTVNGAFTTRSSFPSQKLTVKPTKTTILHQNRTKPISRNQRLVALATPESLTAEEATTTSTETIPATPVETKVQTKSLSPSLHMCVYVYCFYVYCFT